MANGPAETAAARDGQQEEGQQAPTNEKQVQEKLNEAQKRLKQLMEVNRKLHSTLADKKLHAADLKKANEGLLAKLEAREVEEMGRHKQLQDLQQKLQENQTSQQVETLSLQKAVLILEERIEALNEENLNLGERHKENKTLIGDQQNAMKLLQRRSKELSRHIEFMAGHLNEAQLAAEFRGAPSDVDDASTADREKHEKPKHITDFHRLPGLDLQKLLGEDALDIMNLARSRSVSPDPTKQRESRDSSSPTPHAGSRPSSGPRRGERGSLTRTQSRSKSGRSGSGQELGGVGRTTSGGSRPGSGASGDLGGSTELATAGSAGGDIQIQAMNSIPKGVFQE